MSIPRRKEPMANLIRDLHMHNAHQDALVSGRAIPTEDEPAKPKRTYSTVWHEMPWCDGYNVVDDRTGVMMRSEPFRTERLALEYIDELEAEFGK